MSRRDGYRDPRNKLNMGTSATTRGAHYRRDRKRMRRQVLTGGRADGPIRVQLDARTVITLLNMKALAFWRQRYPNLKVL